MKTNVACKAEVNHYGVKTVPSSAIEQLRRSVMACMLWEDGFYEDGQTIAERIKALVPRCKPAAVADLAIKARTEGKLRHAPLLLVRELARAPSRCEPMLIAHTLNAVIQRADELAEFLALYWADGKKPIAKQVKRGLAMAFRKFDEYALAKYNRDGAIKLRDVLFMVHAQPKDDEQAALWKRLVDGQLAPAGTWEERLSAGEDKKSVFEDLLTKKQLGHLALLRNLRNMHQAGVDAALVQNALLGGAAKSKALPFRYIAAARAVPEWELQIDQAMMLSMESLPKLAGETVILVDVSGSMEDKISNKSDLTRADAANALAILLRGVCDQVRVFAFSDSLTQVPPRSGMALADAISNSLPHRGTQLGAAIKVLSGIVPKDSRLIVFTDEESSDPVGAPPCKSYMINVATTKNSVAYGPWHKITGFSESVVEYIRAVEAAESENQR